MTRFLLSFSVIKKHVCDLFNIKIKNKHVSCATHFESLKHILIAGSLSFRTLAYLFYSQPILSNNWFEVSLSYIYS